MKKLLFSALILLAIGANAQETKDTTEIKPAAKGVVYGEFLNTTGAILNVSDLKLQNDNAALDARIVGRAIELGEMRERYRASEAELRRLRLLIGDAA